MLPTSHIELNRYIYNTLVEHALDPKRNNDWRLTHASIAARFAATHYPGLLSDGRLEAAIKEIGTNIAPASCKGRKRRRIQGCVVHIATELYSVGGHTRVLQRIVKTWDKVKHVVILTGVNALPPEVPGGFGDARFIRIQKPSPQTQVREIREVVAELSPMAVILHHHPYDVIAVCALAIDEPPLRIIYNHADHRFWVGASVADLVIDFRHIAATVSREFRGVQRSVVLPLPGPLNRITQRLRPKVRGERKNVQLISVASAYKFLPFEEFDFVADFASFLSHESNVSFDIIGLGGSPWLVDYNLPANLRVWPASPHIDEWLANSDFFIEPYPFGTALGLWDAMHFGCIPVFNYSDVSIYGVGARSLISDSYKSPSTHAEYFSQLGAFVSGMVDETLIEAIEQATEKSEISHWVCSLQTIVESSIHEIRERPFAYPLTGREFCSDACERWARFCATRRPAIRTLLNLLSEKKTGHMDGYFAQRFRAFVGYAKRLIRDIRGYSF